MKMIAREDLLQWRKTNWGGTWVVSIGGAFLYSGEDAWVGGWGGSKHH